MKNFKRLLVMILFLVSFTSVQTARLLLALQQTSAFHSVSDSLPHTVEQYIFNHVDCEDDLVNYLKEKALYHDINIFYYDTQLSFVSDGDAPQSVRLFVLLSDAAYFENYALNAPMDYHEFLNYGKPIKNQMQDDVFLEIIDVGYQFELIPFEAFQGESFSGSVYLTGNVDRISAFRNEILIEADVLLLPYDASSIPESTTVGIKAIYQYFLSDVINSILIFFLILLTIYGCYLKRRGITIMRLHGYQTGHIFLELFKLIMMPVGLVFIPAYAINFLLISQFSFRYLIQTFPHYLSLFLAHFLLLMALIALFAIIFSSNKLVTILKGKSEDRGFVTVMTVVKVVILFVAIGPMTKTLRLIDRVSDAISVNSTYLEYFKDTYAFEAALGQGGFDLIQDSERTYDLLKDEVDLQSFRYMFADEDLDIKTYIAHVNLAYLNHQNLYNEQGVKIETKDITYNTIIVSQTLKKQMQEFAKSHSLFCQTFFTGENRCEDLDVIYTNQDSKIKPYFDYYNLPSEKNLDTYYILQLTDHTPIILNLFFSVDDSSEVETIRALVDEELPKNYLKVINLHEALESNYKELLRHLFKNVLDLLLYALMVFVALMGSYYIIYNATKKASAIKLSHGIRARSSLLVPFLIQSSITLITFVIYIQLIHELEKALVLNIIAGIIIFDVVSFLLISNHIEKSLVHVIKEGI